MKRTAPDQADPCDFLFLNASNYPGRPVFPYAFVQVSALARQQGLTVKRFDFMGYETNEWPGIVQELIAKHQPRMVGLHIRQADSQHLNQIKQVEGAPPPKEAYFPVDDSRLLIDLVRSQTEAPIVVGGFGFTVHPQRIFDFLQIDYGVCGEPDEFFIHFDSLAGRDISFAAEVANLIYRDETGRCRINPRQFLPPLDAPEYDDEIFSELCQFYARHQCTLSLGGLGEVDPAIEVMRGCPCSCYFCTEPTVKGRRLRRRNLDVVMEEVAFLAQRGIRCVWFICSEINIGGMDFPLEIASRMQAFNDSHPSRSVLWRTYNMPRPGMSRQDLQIMMRAGYIPGWNEFVSFSDRNLKKSKMPYRAERAVEYLNDILELSKDRSLYHGPPPRSFEMFLGNVHMDGEALRETLDIIDREGYADLHEYGHAILATRVYELNGKLNCGTLDQTITISPDGEKPEADLLHPSFQYSQELVRVLGNVGAVERFLQYVAYTFFSRHYREALDLPGFVAATIGAEGLVQLLKDNAEQGLRICLQLADSVEKEKTSAESELTHRVHSQHESLWRLPAISAIGQLLEPDSQPRLQRNQVMERLLDVLFKLNEAAFESVWAFLCLHETSVRSNPYRVTQRLLARFESREELLAQTTETLGIYSGSISYLQLRTFLYTSNVRFEPGYRELLVGTLDPQQTAVPHSLNL